MPSPKSTTWVAVADGAKALVMENTGTDAEPSLSVLSVRETEDPPTRDLGAHKPGRLKDSGVDRGRGDAGWTGQRSGVADTDWHRFEEERFAASFAEMLGRAAAAGLYDRLVLIAPPRALGDLRQHLDHQARERLVADLDRDLTNHPVPEIEEHVAKLLKPGLA
jgi:protein required for attachment to host cells